MEGSLSLVKRRGTFTKLVVNIIFIIYSLMCLIPIWMVLSVSLTHEKSIITEGYHLFPKDFSLAGYWYAFSGSTSILNAYKITILVTVVGTILHLLITSMLSYAISRPEVRYRNQIAFLVFFTILFNGGLAPYYILITKYLHLKDTLFVLIVVLLLSPVHVMIMRNFFKALPDSITEAARIDGSGEFNTFFGLYYRCLLQFLQRSDSLSPSPIGMTGLPVRSSSRITNFILSNICSSPY